VFAISLLTVNGLPDFARSLVRTQQQDSKVDTAGAPIAAAHPRGGSHMRPAQTSEPLAVGRDVSGKIAALPGKAKAAGSAGSTTSTAQSPPGASATAQRRVINLITPKTLQEHIKALAEHFGRTTTFVVSVTATDTSADALTQLCATSAKSGSTLGIASVPRRITRAEYDVCTRNLGGIAEAQLGHQVIVLARSRLYGAPALSAGDIFLALAAEIPDPAHPEILISNPNTTWDRVNGTLNDEPIEVFGPPAQSMTGIAFREMLLEVGCNSFSTIAALKQTDPARYERVCTTLRKDGVYSEMPEVAFDVFQLLQSHPNAVGVLAYGLFQNFAYYPQGKETLATSPIGGVEPTREAIDAGTYPGSRTLYLYVDQSRANGNAPFLITSLVETSRFYWGSYSVIPLDSAQVQTLRNNSAKLPDLKL